MTPRADPSDAIECANLAPRRWLASPPASIRVVDWNIDRGLHLTRVVEFLKRSKTDVIMLQEVDQNTRRTGHINVARVISEQLQMNYVFGREFEELTQESKGSRAYQGQATLSRWPISNARVLRFREQSTFWRPHAYMPRWSVFQERLGGRMALIADIQIAGRTIRTYNLHLESRGDDRLRVAQLGEVFEDVRGEPSDMPVIVAGDLNLDASTGEVAAALYRAHFQNGMGSRHLLTTPARSMFESGRSIDALFTRGPKQVSNLSVRREVRASDHYPIYASVDM
jgi:endonuclease/exonuclease/phosphatase family metal-dependent hydrolase